LRRGIWDTSEGGDDLSRLGVGESESRIRQGIARTIKKLALLSALVVKEKGVCGPGA
jgi:hypothetical protein